MKLERFLEDLASGKPTPGGGSASALAGSLSASLVAMVAGLSVKDERIRKEMEGARKEALSIREKLFLAISEDAASFDAVMDAFHLSKETEKDCIYRSRMIQRAYRQACVIPKRVSECSVALLRLSSTMISKGNPNARSDAAVAAYLANAALEGGIINIRVNLLTIRDRAFRLKMEGLMDRLAKERDRQLGKILPELKKVSL